MFSKKLYFPINTRIQSKIIQKDIMGQKNDKIRYILTSPKQESHILKIMYAGDVLKFYSKSVSLYMCVSVKKSN